METLQKALDWQTDILRKFFPANGRKHKRWFNFKILFKCSWKRKTGFNGYWARKVTETQRTLTEEKWNWTLRINLLKEKKRIRKDSCFEPQKVKPLCLSGSERPCGIINWTCYKERRQSPSRHGKIRKTSLSNQANYSLKSGSAKIYQHHKLGQQP